MQLQLSYTLTDSFKSKAPVRFILGANSREYASILLWTQLEGFARIMGSGRHFAVLERRPRPKCGRD